MNLFNIGVEGQYRVASYVAAVFAGAALLPGLRSTSCSTLIVAMVVGAAWAGIAGVLKVTRGVSEVISTIMLNAIAITLIGYLLNTYGEQAGNARRTDRARGGQPAATASRRSSTATAPIWTLAILAVAGRRRASRSCSTGPASASTCAPPACPRPPPSPRGVNVKRMVVDLDAALGRDRRPDLDAGAVRRRHSYGTTFQAGLGFTGIAVALLGRNRPLGIVFGALLFAFLNEQSNRLTLADRHLAERRPDHPGRHRARRRRRLRGRPQAPGGRRATAGPAAARGVRRRRARGGVGMSTRLAPPRPAPPPADDRYRPLHRGSGSSFAAHRWRSRAVRVITGAARDRLARAACAPRSSPPARSCWPASAASGRSGPASSTSASRA